MMNTRESTEQTYSVPGVSCGHCRVAILEHVSPLHGVERVEVDLDAKTATVIGDADRDAVTAAIDEAGYDAVAEGQSEAA